MNNQSMFEILRAEVNRTQQEYDESKEHFWRISAEPPKPDRRDRIQLAARDQTLAMIAYTKALRQFNEFLLTGRVPDELSRSVAVRQTTVFTREQRQVAKCVFCEAETRMYENDHPICNDCASCLDRGEKLTRKRPTSDKGPIEEKTMTAGS